MAFNGVNLDVEALDPDENSDYIVLKFNINDTAKPVGASGEGINSSVDSAHTAWGLYRCTRALWSNARTHPRLVLPGCHSDLLP